MLTHWVGRAKGHVYRHLVRIAGDMEGRNRLGWALAVYRFLSALAPGHVELVQACANLLGRLGRSKEALKAYQEVVRLQPDSAFAHFRIAEILTYLGRYREALPHFGRTVKLNPEWLEAQEVYGRALWICHDYESAEEVWRHWLSSQAQVAAAQGHDPSAFRILNTVWCGWLGNNAHLDAYVKIGLLGWRPGHAMKLLAPADRVANQAYLRGWEPYVDIVTDGAEVERLSALNSTLGDSLYTMVVNGTPTYFPNAIALAQGEWERQNRPPLMKLNSAELDRGRHALAKLGVPRDDWYVCLHVREAGFWNEAGDPSNAPRVADISTYLPAIERIITRGGVVIRLGDKSMRPLPAMKGLIDYARSDAKSDWMDVFLCSTCRFLIGTNSAMYQVAVSFGVPVLVTNWMPLSSFPVQAADVVLPKLIYSEEKSGILSFSEMLDLPRDIWSGHFFHGRHLTPVSNTEQDLLAGVEEMLDRDPARLADRDADGQALCEIARSHRVRMNGRIGKRFLQAHPDFLAETSSLDSGRLRTVRHA